MNDVTRVGDNALIRRKFVILFVPGVMGTRLYFTKAKEYWDPDDKWRMSHWLLTGMPACAREFHKSQPTQVVADEKGLSRSEQGRGWSGVVGTFYLPFLRHLVSKNPGASVYATGYDWRQSIWNPGGNNSKSSAQHLINDIERIRKAEFKSGENQELVIVTHSMGGLVTRAALKAKPTLQKEIAGVIHVVQPVHGAPVAYRRFFTGTLKEHTDPKPLAKILGDTAEKFTAMMHGLPGPIQLIPNNHYRRRALRPWLLYHEHSQWQPFVGDVYKLYQKPDGPPGLIMHKEYDGKHSKLKKPSYMSELMDRVDEARKFHAWLNDGTSSSRFGGGQNPNMESGGVKLSTPEAFKHDNTYSIFSTKLETDMACGFNPYKKPNGSKKDSDAAWHDHNLWETSRGMNRQRFEFGDGTVPESSGAALFPLEYGDPAKVPQNVLDASPRQVRIESVEHGGAFHSKLVKKIVDNWIPRILLQHAMKQFQAPDGGG